MKSFASPPSHSRQDALRFRPQRLDPRVPGEGHEKEHPENPPGPERRPAPQDPLHRLFTSAGPEQIRAIGRVAPRPLRHPRFHRPNRCAVVREDGEDSPARCPARRESRIRHRARRVAGRQPVQRAGCAERAVRVEGDRAVDRRERTVVREIIVRRATLPRRVEIRSASPSARYCAEVSRVLFSKVRTAILLGAGRAGGAARAHGGGEPSRHCWARRVPARQSDRIGMATTRRRVRPPGSHGAKCASSRPGAPAPSGLRARPRNARGACRACLRWVIPGCLEMPALGIRLGRPVGPLVQADARPRR